MGIARSRLAGPPLRAGAPPAVSPASPSSSSSRSRSASARAPRCSASWTRCCCGRSRSRSPIGSSRCGRRTASATSTGSSDRSPTTPTGRRTRRRSPSSARSSCRNDNRTDGAQPEKIAGALASSALFRALGVQPVIGRFFRSDEDQPANRHVAVLGYEYWQRAFNGDRGVLGRAVVINGEPYTIVGVMPAQRPWIRADIWRPLAPNLARSRSRRSRRDRRRPARARAVDRAGGSGSCRPSRRDWPRRIPRRTRAGAYARNRSSTPSSSSSTRRAMIILMGAVGLLLLIACVNVANLMLARATEPPPRDVDAARAGRGARAGRASAADGERAARVRRRRGRLVRRGVGPAPRAVALPRRHPRPDRRGDQSLRAALRAWSRRC